MQFIYYLHGWTLRKVQWKNVIQQSAVCRYRNTFKRIFGGGKLPSGGKTLRKIFTKPWRWILLYVAELLIFCLICLFPHVLFIFNLINRVYILSLQHIYSRGQKFKTKQRNFIIFWKFKTKQRNFIFFWSRSVMNVRRCFRSIIFIDRRHIYILLFILHKKYQHSVLCMSSFGL